MWLHRSGLCLGLCVLGAVTGSSDRVVSPDVRVRQLLEATQGKEANEWAALLMKADEVAVQLQARKAGGCCGYRCLRLGQYTLTFPWDEIGRTEIYQHDLLRTVVEARRGTETGAVALARLLSDGCGLLSNDWTPYFRTVLDILNFPAWENVNSTALTRIRAQALETWWSLSQASPAEFPLKDNDVRQRDFERGADEARAQAIAAYQSLIARNPQDTDARERLRRLMASEDTHQRRWYCFGD